MLGIVAVVLCAVMGPGLAGDGTQVPTLAAELLIVRGDVARLDAQDLPAAHRDGLRRRIQGALGLLPWLLRRAGDADGAVRLRDWRERALNADGRARLDALLERLSARHPLDVDAFAARPANATRRRDARAIHQTYCAGCHDGRGRGDPDVSLPARDLFRMAREEEPPVFLARLINGVRGTAEIGFANPLTPAQIAALWRLYRAP